MLYAHLFQIIWGRVFTQEEMMDKFEYGIHNYHHYQEIQQLSHLLGKSLQRVQCLPRDVQAHR